MLNGMMSWRYGGTALRIRPLISCGLLATLTACGGQSFPEAMCERVKITHDGAPVIGVEDMAYDAPTQTLYLSAYDRRTYSTGGIYRLPIEMANTATDLDVTAVIDNIRPHGIDLTRTNRALTQKFDDVLMSFIERQGTQSDKTPIIRTLSWNDDAPDSLTEVRVITGSEICASNDIVRTHRWGDDSAIFVTQDHKNCTLKAQNRENIFSPNKASVGIIDTINHQFRYFLTGLSFANGIVLSKDDQRLYIAETRGKRVTLFSTKTGETTEKSLAGGPDNLTQAGDNIYAALIPSLIKFKRFSSGKHLSFLARQSQ